MQLGIHGPVLSVSTACTSSTDAIGVAKALIEAGQADVIIAGGAEAPICPMLFAAFDRLGMMSKSFNDEPETASRPFSVDRDGFVLGEGAVMLVLESVAHAHERGARILASISGYAATCDANSHFSQDEGGADAELAVRRTLEGGGVVTGEIDYVNAHGSATRQNDAFESALIKRIFAERATEIPISSSKSFFGHLLGCCGAAEVAAIVAGMSGGFIPPTLNLHHPDPALALDFVPHRARPGAIDTALSINFGFGSRNAAVLLRAAPAK
jgi:3-oxoacyl-[acyl-carrier-protein] synthase II